MDGYGNYCSSHYNERGPPSKQFHEEQRQYKICQFRSKRGTLWLKFIQDLNFQNEFLKSSFLPKYEPKIERISQIHSEIYCPGVLVSRGQIFGGPCILKVSKDLSNRG